MGLTARRDANIPHETWPNMLAAAEQRFMDALTLACSDPDRGSGAIYLFGYAAEALLKTAYCQFNQLPQSANMYAFLKSQFAGGALHRPVQLLDSLIIARTAVNDPMDASVAGVARQHALIVEQHWDVKMRYFDFAATSDEVNEMLTSVEGLLAVYQDLWN